MYDAGHSKTVLGMTTWRDGVGREVRGWLRREWTHVCLWLIHTNVW